MIPASAARSRQSETSTGPTTSGWSHVGTGLEYAFWGNWSAKIEYNYIDFRHKDYNFLASFVDGDLSFKFDFGTTVYTLGEFTSEEYPTLVPQGETTDTIAVPAVLAVFNWPKNTDRYRRVQRFTEALFTKWDKFSEPQRHPKWRDINLAATVPGWTRWSVAEQMLSRMKKDPRVAESQQKDPGTGEFWTFLKQQSPAVMNLTQEQREALYHDFLKWQKQR